MRTIGYVENEGAAVKWDLMTNVIAGYVDVGPDGMLPSLASMKPTLDTCKRLGIPCEFQLYTSWGSSGPAYNRILTDSVLSQNLINSIVSGLKAYPFDGVNFDWESSNQSGLTPASYTAFFKRLAAALRPLGKTISAVENYGRVTLLPEAQSYLNWIGLMTYDTPDPWYCSLSMQKADLDRWANAGFAAKNLVAGITFAVRGADSSWWSYRSMIDRYNPPDSANEANGNFYNGLDLVGEKAKQAKSYGGVFVYTAEFDHPVRSLLQRIHDVTQDATPTIPPTPPPTPEPPPTPPPTPPEAPLPVRVIFNGQQITEAQPGQTVTITAAEPKLTYTPPTVTVG